MVKYSNVLFFTMLFLISVELTAQPQQSLEGVWRSTITGYNEYLGHYEIKIILTIQNSQYTWLTERVSEAMFWSSGERGILIINDSEIIFSQKERTFNQWNPRWENEDGINIYLFRIDDNVLILNQDNKILIFEKDL